MRIMVSPTGARLGKRDNPQVPLTIAEIVDTTRRCAEAGANALHLHIRDETGAHSLDSGLYSEALTEMSEAMPDFPVQITTEAAGRFSPEDQCALLETLAPRWVSISLREAARDRATAIRMYEVCKANGTEIQHIVYDAEDAELLRDWQRQSVLTETESVILVLGRYANGVTARPDDLAPLLSRLPPVGDWMVCAFGATEHECLAMAAKQGGDVRVGFENSTVDRNGETWADNAASVRALCQSLELEPCS